MKDARLQEATRSLRESCRIAQREGTDHQEAARIVRVKTGRVCGVPTGCTCKAFWQS